MRFQIKKFFGITELDRIPGDSKDVVVRQVGSLRALSIGGRLTQSILDTSGMVGNQVWNYFLLAPYFAQALPSKPRMCILGYGAGTVARLYRRFYPAVQITGVEKDASVLTAARKYFDPPIDVSVICDDALSFIQKTGDCYTFILVDLFDAQGTIAAVADAPFIAAVCKHTQPQGVMVINCVGQAAAWEVVAQHYAQTGRTVFRLPLKLYGVHNNLLFVSNQHSMETIFTAASAEQRPALQHLVKNLQRSLQQWQ